MLTKAVVLTLAVVLFACSNEAVLEEDPVGATIQPIFGGVSGGAPSVVGLNFRSRTCTPEKCDSNECTGTIVSSHLILTASHCLTKANWEVTGDSRLSGRVSIEYDDPATGNVLCLSRFGGDVNGRCGLDADSDYVTLTGFVNPAFRGGGDRANDESLVGGLSLEWPEQIGPDDSAAYAVSSLRDAETTWGAAVRPRDSFFAIGFGGNGGSSARVLRVAPNAFSADATDNGVLRDVAGDVRMCDGDSGSPALWIFDDVPIAAGVHSADDSGRGCATPGSNQFWALTETHARFITSVIEGIGDTCEARDFLSSPQVRVATIKCW